MDQVDNSPTLINIFIAFQIAGTGIWLLILLTAIFSPQVVRHPTWFSFCLSWVVWGVSFSLLFFAGQQRSTTPRRAVCIAQAALVYTVPILAASASLALIIFLLLTVRSTLLSPTTNKHRYAAPILVSIPWVCGILIFISFLVHSIRHQNEVGLSHNGTYCVLNEKYIPKFTAAMVVALAIAIFTIEVIIAVVIYPHRKRLDGFQQSTALGLQLVLFTAVVFCSAGTGLVFVITKTRGAIFDIMMAIVPLVGGIIFASQRDILVSWLFWRSSSSTPAPNVSNARTEDSVESYSIGSGINSWQLSHNSSN